MLCNGSYKRLYPYIYGKYFLAEIRPFVIYRGIYDQYRTLGIKHNGLAMREAKYELEQLERPCPENTPHPHPHLMITHTIDSYWIPSQKKTKSKIQIQSICQNFTLLSFEKTHLHMQHTFWSCLIGCVNIKRIQQLLLKIQSGHDSVHRQTDEQGDTSIPPVQLRWSRGYNQEGKETGTEVGLLKLHSLISHKENIPSCLSTC